MSEKVDLKVVATIIGVVMAIAGAAGSWYVNSYRLDEVEKDAIAAEEAREADNEEVMKKIAEVKCFMAELHEVPLPECR